MHQSTHHEYVTDRNLGQKSARYEIPDVHKSSAWRAEDIEAQESKSVIYAEEDPNKDEDEILLSSRNNWFVSKVGAVPEAACNWLQLLHDTRKTNLSYRIEPKRLSIDYLPRDVLRPLASADLSDFLTIMTVFGVKWEGRGAAGKFIGRGSLNDITVTSTEVPSVGTVYTYTSRFVQRDVNAYSINSSLAWRSMFNCFYLSNSGNLLTWSSDEVKDSLLDIFGDENLANHFKKTFRTDGFNIGIGELVAAWCYAISMPRRDIEDFGDTKQFATSFSAASLGCTFGIPLLASILSGNKDDLEKHNLLEEPDAQKLVEWVKTHYLDSESFDRDDLTECLGWASGVLINRNILFASSIDLSLNSKCLELIRRLDSDLNFSSFWKVS